MKFLKELSLRKRLYLLISLILTLLFIGLAIFLLTKPKETEAGWWNQGWLYRRSIALENPSSALTNAQIKIFDVHDLSALVTAGKLQSALEDLRFTDYYGNLLQYYIEDDTPATAEVWILIPTLIEGDSSIFMYYGNSSATSASNSSWMADLGGTVSYLEGYRIHAFLNTGSATYVSYAGREVEALVVAGGGGGGAVSGAGGGAGGLILESTHSLSPGVDVSVTVGAGGAGGIDQNTKGTNGGNSLFGLLESIGGGGGGSISNRDGNDGGSGGGANSRPSALGGSAILSGIQGSDGGDGVGANTASSGSGAGGGGFSEAGDDTPDEWNAGDGGEGVYYGDIFGDTYGESGYFAGGGGGGYSNYGTNPGGYAGVGGNGGGGDGKTGLVNGDNGLVNTGGGGGGGGYNGASWTGGNGGAGGSGIVLVRYETNINTPTNIIIGSPSTTEEVSPAPVAYWKFDEGTGVVAHDASGQGNDGTITGATWKTDKMCVSGNCLEFDGTNDYISLNNPGFSDNAKITITGWAKGDFQKRSGLLYAGAVGGQIFGVRDGKLHTYITTTTVETGTILDDNTWYFFAITYDGATFRQYVNGVEENSANVGYITEGGSSWRIGESTASDRRFNGFIDEVKIYPYARTPDEIKSDYAAGLSGIGSTLGASTSFGDYSPKWMSDGLVGYWKMDESSWTGVAGEVIDHSGNNNHGASVNGATTGVGKFGNGGSFDGLDDYVNIASSDPVGGADEITVSAWIKPVSSSASYSIVDQYQDGVSPTFLFYTSSGTLKGLVEDSNGNKYYGNIADSVVDSTSWQHVVMTWDSNSQVISGYVNGVKQIANATTSITSLRSPAVKNLMIGGGWNNFNGSIDEVRIYNRALSPTEVKDLYKWAPGPVAHYTFDEGSGDTLYDRSGYGNNSISITGTANWDKGRIGTSLYFDGTNNYVDIPPTALPATHNVSFCFWTKGDNQPRQDSIFEARDASNNRVANAHIPWSTDTMYWDFGDATYDRISTALDVKYRNTWAYYCLTSSTEENRMAIYVNGSLYYSETHAKSLSSSPSTFSIGSYADSARSTRYNGWIDEFKIYNYARTQSQIVEDMVATGGPPTPVGYWKFDEGSGTTASDSSGNSNNGTLYGASWTKEGRVGGALSFNGSDNYALLSNEFLRGTKEMTISAWVKRSSSSTYSAIVGEPYSGTLTNRLLNFWGDYFNPGLTVYDSNGNYDKVESDNPHQNGTWELITAVFKGGEHLKLYRNGSEDKSKSTTIESLNSNPGWTTLYIGRYSNYHFNGLIDEVKIYNTALTPEQVLLDYNQGMTATLSGSPSTTGNVWGGSASSEYCIPGDTSTCNPPVGEWLFDENQGSTAKDTSGNGNDGTLVNSPGWTKGEKGSALSFDGINQYVNVPNDSSLAPNTETTIEAWVKPIETSTQQYIANHGNSNGNKRWYFRIARDNVYLGVSSDCSSHSYLVYTPLTNTEDWSHVAFTYKQGEPMKVYINGALANTGSTAGTICNTGTEPLTIGLRGVSTEPFEGENDTFRVYDYARTPAQIAWDYNKGAPIGHWRLDECQGTTVYDVTGNGNNGTINIGATGTQTSVGTCTSGNTTDAWYNGRDGKLNSSLNFDGTDDYVDLGNDERLNFGTEDFSISVWIKNSQPLSGSSDLYGIVNKYGANNNSGWSLGLRGGGYNGVFVRIGSSTGLQEVNPSVDYSSILSDGNWRHISFTRNNGEGNLFIDGTKVGEGTMNKTVTNTITQKIGTYEGSSSYNSNGQIDDVRIYNYSLTEDQIKLLYNHNASVRF